MSALDKTAALQRLEIELSKIHPNEDNPNEMDDATFNLLVNNMEEMGFTDPMLVIPHPEIEGEYKLIGGEHRWEVAKLLGFDTGPATVVTDPNFDQDLQRFQIVRHNIIKGKMNPKKFMALYKNLQKQYSDEVAAEMFGFTDQEAFLKLVDDTKKGLPKTMHQAFDAGKEDLKSIDDLTTLLNHLFTTYGDTLDYNYMVLDYGKKNSLWLRMKGKAYKDALDFADNCKQKGRSADDVMAAVMEKLKEDPELFASIVEECPEVEGIGEAELATLDFLDQMNAG